MSSSSGNGLNNGKTIHVWSAQVEAGSDASSYIPTTSAAATRNGDVLAYRAVGNIDGALGSVYSECYLPVAAAGVWQTVIYLNNTGISTYHIGTKGATLAGALTANARALGAVNKAAGGWSGTTASVVLNGGAVATGAFSAIVTANNVVIGSSLDTPFQSIQGTIRNVRFYATRLSDAELVTMTAPAAGSDLNFPSVHLLLHGNGAEGGTTFTDSSSFALTPTVTGGIITTADAQSFGGKSIRCFSGNTANYLTYSGHTFAAANEAFTLEFWMRINDQVGIGNGYAEPRGEFIRLTSGGTMKVSANGMIANATTHHFALPGGATVTWSTYGLATGFDRVFVMICRTAGNILTVYFNGYYVADFPVTTGVIDGIDIGNRVGDPGRTTGVYIEEVRFTRGIERQLRGSLSIGNLAFTPPTAPFPNTA